MSQSLLLIVSANPSKSKCDVTMECSSLAFVLASVVGSDHLLLYKAKKDVILPDYHNVDNRVKI